MLFLNVKNNLIEAKISTIPRIGLYISSGKLIVPPRKANGIEVMIKGNNLFHLINPAFENLKVTIEETKIFKESAKINPKSPEHHFF